MKIDRHSQKITLEYIQSKSTNDMTFAERCARQGRLPNETGIVGLVALEHGLAYESSTHAVICAQHGLPLDTTSADLEKLFGVPLDEINKPLICYH